MGPGSGPVGLYHWEAEKGEPECTRLRSWYKWPGSRLSHREAAGGWNGDIQFLHQAELPEGIPEGRRATDCTMLRSQRGGHLDLRAEGRGGSRKGRGLNHIDSQ